MGTKIYGLVHPSTGTIRYIGKCVTELHRRLVNHEYKARSGRTQTPVGNWIRKLQAQGLTPCIILLEQVNGSWQEAERRWISELRLQGLRLLNQHPGGNGAHTRASLAPELFALLGKISDARIAEMAGLCRETITYHRKKVGIARSNDRSRSRGTFVKGQQAHNRLRLSEDEVSMLGVKSDTEVAQRLGVGRHAIARHRRERGIKQVKRFSGRKTKLTLTVIKAIRKKHLLFHHHYGSGFVKALADTHKVHYSTIYAALNLEEGQC
jgi:hypothetical protein